MGPAGIPFLYEVLTPSDTLAPEVLNALISYVDGKNTICLHLLCSTKPV